MKKLINTSMIYFILALAAGVFYREFTKFNGFSGSTALGRVHTHLFVLGMLIFLIAALFAKNEEAFTESKSFKIFYIMYNIALPLMACTMIFRGILQVQGTALTKALDASISGIAGISHILMAIALAMFFAALKKALLNTK